MKNSFFVSNLRCEYMETPLGIDVPEPRLSWLIHSERRGAMQSGYQIHAEDAFSGLVLWDSGKVLSNSSNQVEYSGSPLKSQQCVEWKVRTWDEFDHPSNWSKVSWWEMGLLVDSDWDAEWIGASLVGGPRTSSPCPYMRHEFDLAEHQPSIKRARLYITALGLYDATLNGQIVGGDVLNPGWTDFRKRVRYRAYDVTALVKPGRNSLAIILGDGWYCGNLEVVGRQFYGDRPKLLAQLQIDFEDSTQQRVVTNKTWKTAFGPILESDLMMGESYDARLEFEGWDLAGFNDNQWMNVEVFPDSGVKKVGINSPMVKRIQELNPVSDPVEVSGWPSSKWIFDFGQNMVGHVRMKVKGPRGTTVTLRHAEVLNPDGTLYTANLRTARQTDIYTLKGNGEEYFEPRFTFHGFRYVEVSGYPGTPPRHLLKGVVVHSDVSSSGSFECSDPMVNQLQHNILWGQKGNFVDVPTDCPQRDERLGWTGDAQVFIRTATFNLDVAGFYSKWQQDLADAQNEIGAVPTVAPNTHVSRIMDGGPAWADAMVICPWTIYLTYGDKRLLETHYESLEHFMDYLNKSSTNFIRIRSDLQGSENKLGASEGYGDWLAQDGSGNVFGATPKDLIGTALYAYCAKLMAQIASVLDKPADTKKYENLYESIREAFIGRFVTKDGLVIGQTQTAYVLALHFDLLPEELRPVAVQALVGDIERRNDHLSTGFVGTPYLPFVLTDNGRRDLAYALLLQKSWPSWLYPVTQGATTIWERWDGWTDDKGFQDAGMNSFNHYAYGSIGAWLYAVVAGIDADYKKPGFKHILLKPQPGGGLSYAKAAYDSINGRIESSWNIANGCLNWEVSVPANTTATAFIPTRSGCPILESGIPLGSIVGITSIQEDKDTVICELGSGKYRFTVELFSDKINRENIFIERINQ